MKIDFIIGKIQSGGGERVLSILANYFAEKGHRVRVITFIHGDSYQLNPNIERIRFHKKRLINYAVVRGFFSLLTFYAKKKNRPDIISSHIDYLGYATILPAKLYGIKIVVSEHSNHVSQPQTLALKFLWNVLYKLPDAVTVLTKFDFEYFAKRNRNVVVMPNPCSFETIKNVNGEREKTVLAVGNLNRYQDKGFHNLIPIASEVLKVHPDWSFKIVGEGNHGLKALTALVKEYHLEDKVHFLGFRKDVKALMATSEIFVLTSRYEGLPMVLLEAMSQGMACAAYNCISGPSDIITHEVDGVLVENQNKEKMIEALLKLIENKYFREKIQVKAVESIKKFSIEKIGEKWEQLFQEILQ